ncbi:hypothetical protein PC129_g16559 [Phytophthora cactorum]|uniref:Uncharacterized protein n=1 Tax=Phytophthora cactorum TaxID=29920 RepID=A0A8T1HJX8_9STRA|nr:hypothetical protein PC113_g15993 [Phytophthora cactorum]KAG2903108.1 hypothetical protein PC115_g15431 [Phytophthora cactorum]KAG2915877.1 hypothetical protein PC114_g7670 [Phytophthora cactorum]KAG2972156.1 hypothetical protein PC118_g15840 [Phytophthora cactorum]KAG3175421.1 hypothetical protein C6341_g9468 [Phytophthora cactorum]
MCSRRCWACHNTTERTRSPATIQNPRRLKPCKRKRRQGEEGTRRREEHQRSVYSSETSNPSSWLLCFTLKASRRPSTAATMPKRKANWWPPSILSDRDVLSMDDEGRFVLCKICHVHYAVHGGKKPKPVIMNSNFRTRAWDVHKERTNSHRLQKQQERLQQAKAQSQATGTQGQQQSQQQQHQQQQMQPGQGQQVQQSKPSQTQSQAQEQSQSVPALATKTQTLTQEEPPRQVQGQVQHALAPPTHQQSPPRASPQSHSGTQALQQQDQQQQQELEETKDAGQGRLQVAARNSAAKRPASASSGPGTVKPAATMAVANTVHHGGMMNTGKRPATTMPTCTPMQRRRVHRAGSPSSSKQLSAGAAAHTHEKHSFVAPGVATQKKSGSNENDVAMEQQADSSARWRHMHDDVSRALNAAPRRRQPGPTSYTSGELRAAKTLVQTETGDLGSNNSERVAKKLRSLNAEYHASNMRHGDAYNMRHTDVFDRRSAGYKEYWGTLRDVYTSSGSGGSGPGNSTPCRKSHHPSLRLVKPVQEESKETEADTTTPDDSGSSEDAFKPAVVVHDASLVNAIKRLTDVTSNHIANLYQKEASSTREALAGLTSVMTDMRVQHGNAFERMIELQEKHLKVMEGILEIKLRKEAARNAINGSGGGSSGGSHGDSSNGGGSAPNQGAESAFQSQSG